MKFKKKIFSVAILSILVISMLAGCSNKSGDDATADVEGDATAYNYSSGLDESGMWEGIVALDYVELFDYNNMEIPADQHTVTEEDVDAQVEMIVANLATQEQITDRAVVDGDTLNIDYVGSVDGVEFEGGSTNGAGQEVTIGVTSFIDGFLPQLIGHSPGENFDIDVTFPEDYHSEDLKGKDAVFNITINYIAESVEPELTDELVAESLSGDYGWATISEMKEGIKEDMEKSAMTSYLQQAIVDESNIKEVPESLIKYNENIMVQYYTETAASYGMELEDLLKNMIGVESVEELRETEQESNIKASSYSLVIQAIAEDAKITVSDDDVSTFFKEEANIDDYSPQKEQYGMPYLKHIVLDEKVLTYLEDNATLL